MASPDGVSEATFPPLGCFKNELSKDKAVTTDKPAGSSQKGRLESPEVLAVEDGGVPHKSVGEGRAATEYSCGVGVLGTVVGAT